MADHVEVAPSDLRFQGRTNGNSPDSTDSVRVREALSACVRNNGSPRSRREGKFRIRLGERAWKVREGKEEVARPTS
jgi:hypothetical protein